MSSKSPKGASSSSKKSKGLTEWEIAAMKETLQERKGGSGEGEGAVLAKIAEMGEPDRSMATRVHAIIKSTSPGLSPRTWYGMPAYARGDKIVCFFQAAAKFKARYATLGFSDKANLDDGQMWPTAFAIKKLGPTEEAEIRALVKRAAS